MTKASDNPFPSLLLTETAAASIGTPAAGKRRLFVDTDNVLKWKEEGGAVQPIAGVNKWDATTAPTANEDSGDGYAVGSRWIDVTNDKEYVCLDASVGAAVWTETTGAGGGGGSVATDAIWDAKGDLAVGTGADTAARLAVGTNGQVLTADSGETTGVKWAAAGGGAGFWNEIVAASDQTVTNSTTLVDDTELTFATDAGGYYDVEFSIPYAGDVSSGLRWRFSLPALTVAAMATGWDHGVSNSLTAQNTAGRIGTTGTPGLWPNTEIQNGSSTIDDVLSVRGSLRFASASAGTCVFRFAEVAAAGGRRTDVKAGRYLRYRKLG